MTVKARVMLVDDHALCRSGLTELLEHRGNMEVVVATGDPAQVVPLLREHQPDLMVLDLRLAKIDGLSVLRMVRNEGCETPVVILTMSDSEEDMAAALRMPSEPSCTKPKCAMSRKFSTMRGALAATS